MRVCNGLGSIISSIHWIDSTLQMKAWRKNRSRFMELFRLLNCKGTTNLEKLLKLLRDLAERKKKQKVSSERIRTLDPLS